MSTPVYIKPIIKDDQNGISLNDSGDIIVDGVVVDVGRRAKLVDVLNGTDSLITVDAVNSYIDFTCLNKILNAMVVDNKLASEGVQGNKLAIAVGNSVKEISQKEDFQELLNSLSEESPEVTKSYKRLNYLIQSINRLGYYNFELKTPTQVADYLSILDFKYDSGQYEDYPDGNGKIPINYGDGIVTYDKVEVTWETYLTRPIPVQLIKEGDLLEITIKYLAADPATYTCYFDGLPITYDGGLITFGEYAQNVESDLITVVDSVVQMGDFLIDITPERLVVYSTSSSISEFYIDSVKVHHTPEYSLNFNITWDDVDVSYDSIAAQYVLFLDENTLQL